MGGFEPSIVGLASVGGLASLFATTEGYQGAVFFGIQGYLGSLVSLGLDNLDKPVAAASADDPDHGYCSLWLPAIVVNP